ncbi:AMP-binding protein [Nocardia fluminea]|uniref:AMP-binding protein n=1 Tax=Nocardia fluminea TaxID=134984 RepID=UPI00341C2D8F
MSNTVSERRTELIWSPGDNCTLVDLIERRANISGDRAALTVAGETVTFSDLASQSIGYANGLHSLGVRRGDPVVMLMDNTVPLVNSWFGSSRLGAVDIPVNTQFSAEFLRRTFSNAGASVLLLDEQYLEKVLAAGRDGGIETVVFRGSEDGRKELAKAGFRALPWEELSGGPVDALTFDVSHDYRDPASVIYTSGTTGPSKGVLYSHNYVLSSSYEQVRLYEGREDDVYYGSMPLFHLASRGAGVVGALMAGHESVIDAKFSTSMTWDRVRATGATVVHMLGSMMVMLWNLPPEPRDRDLPMRAFYAAPVPGSLHHAFEERFGCKIVTAYAQTEICTVTGGGLADEIKLDSAGRVNNELLEVAIVDDRDEEVPADAVGEIAVRPKRPHIMFEGYWRNPEATHESMKNLWYHTGDLGRIDEDGFLFYEGRKKDALRRRGENISAVELESAVREHPSVLDVAAIGIPSDVLEDDIFVVFELVEGAVADYESLHAYCVEALPRFMVPRYLEAVDEIPRNSNNKIEKFRLRERGTTSLTWDTESKTLLGDASALETADVAGPLK